MITWAWHFYRAFKVTDAAQRREEIFDRVAFLTRYGHIPYSEAIAIPLDDVQDYLSALARMVQQENKPPTGA